MHPRCRPFVAHRRGFCFSNFGVDGQDFFLHGAYPCHEGQRAWQSKRICLSALSKGTSKASFGKEKHFESVSLALGATSDSAQIAVTWPRSLRSFRRLDRRGAWKLRTTEFKGKEGKTCAFVAFALSFRLVFIVSD